jgi:hypothetical protein
MPLDEVSPPLPRRSWAAAAALAPMVDVWRRLLDEHVASPSGRCRACTQGGTGIPTERWPCGPRKVAEAASRLHAEARPERDSA